MTMTPDTQPTTISTRVSTRLRVALIVSLGVNLLVAGVVGGGMIAGRGPGPFGGIEMNLGPIGQALSREDRRAIVQELRNQRELRPLKHRERREALAAFISELRSDPFDPAAIEAIFAEQRDRATQGMRLGQDIILRRLSALSHQGRIDFADRLERGGERGDD